MERKIVESSDFTAQINALRVNYRRLDEAIIGVHEAVVRSPEKFPNIPGTKLHRLKLIGFDGVPALSIYLTFNETEVHLVWAELIEDEG